MHFIHYFDRLAPPPVRKSAHFLLSTDVQTALPKPRFARLAPPSGCKSTHLQSCRPALIRNATTHGKKVPIRYLTVNGLLVLLLLQGCGPIVSQASFRQRPNSVKVGSMIGPYEGRVIDADTKEPIQGAIVWCSWAFTRGIGNQAPEAALVKETSTNANGQYTISALRQFPIGLSTQLGSFSMVIYKKGYVAYRHDRVFNQQHKRRTFSQLNNLVRLSRWSPELSHAAHVMFLGSGTSLVKASRWEMEKAAAEMSGQLKRTSLSFRPKIKDKRRLDASVLLSSDDVRDVTGYTGQFLEGRLAGKSTDTYDSFHLRALHKPERYDVAIRLWRLSDAELVEKYEETLNSLPGSKQTDEVGDRSYIVLQGEILGLGFMDRSASALVLLTCGKGQCPQDKLLIELAKRAHKKLGRLPSTSADDDSLIQRDPSPQDETP